MRQKHTFVIVTLAAIGLAQVQAEPVQIAPVSPSRWSIGVGAVFRDIEADFHLHSPGRLSTGGLFRGPSGRGDVGLFTGGSGIVHYDDGQVGPEGFFLRTPGTYAHGVINNSSQVTDSGRTSTLGSGVIHDIKFHTTGTEYSYASRYALREFNSSDSETGVGPYLELRYAAFQGERADVNVVFGYSWVSADLGSGDGVLATHTITETKDFRRYTYAYDADEANPTAFNGPYPEVVAGVDNIIIINGANANANSRRSQFQDPRKSVKGSRSSRTVAEFVAIGSASLDIDLHELVLAPELSCDLGQRLHLGVSLGPTVNFVNTDLDAQAAWYRRGSSKAILTYHASDSGTKVKPGVAAQLSVVFDITERLFIQASGSYRWVDDFDVQAGFAKANVDLSAWQGAVGLGIRL